MNRPLKTLDLPISGYKAEIITYWTFGERQEITKTLLSDTSIDPQSGSVGEIKAEKGVEIQKTTLKMGVKKLTNEKGEQVSIDELFDVLPASDVDLIVTAINELDAGKKN